MAQISKQITDRTSEADSNVPSWWECHKTMCI